MTHTLSHRPRAGISLVVSPSKTRLPGWGVPRPSFGEGGCPFEPGWVRGPLLDGSMGVPIVHPLWVRMVAWPPLDQPMRLLENLSVRSPRMSAWRSRKAASSRRLRRIQLVSSEFHLLALHDGQAGTTLVKV